MLFGKHFARAIIIVIIIIGISDNLRESWIIKWLWLQKFKDKILFFASALINQLEMASKYI